jgi:hypothetical protein
VTVTDRYAIEKYSHVMHIVSEVRGRLKPRASAIDVLRANRATPDFDTINFGNEKREIISNGFFESVWNRFGLETITTLGRIVYELECSARVANPFDSDLSLLVGQVQKTSNT